MEFVFWCWCWCKGGSCWRWSSCRSTSALVMGRDLTAPIMVAKRPLPADAAPVVAVVIVLHQPPPPPPPPAPPPPPPPSSRASPASMLAAVSAVLRDVDTAPHTVRQNARVRSGQLESCSLMPLKISKAMLLPCLRSPCSQWIYYCLYIVNQPKQIYTLVLVFLLFLFSVSVCFCCFATFLLF